MGGFASTERDRKKKELFLIGKLYNKTETERKIYLLANLCLDGNCLIIHKENKFSQKVSDTVDLNTEHCISSGKDLFSVILPPEKSLYSTETYVSWRSRNDLERLSSMYREKNDISVVQIDNFPNFLVEFSIESQDEKLSFHALIEKFLNIYFLGKNVKWINPVEICKIGWKISSRHHQKTGKFQYLVKDFYVPLQKLKPSASYCIMGFSWHDLYPSEKLNFVLGEASSVHKAGVVSFGRCEPKMYEPETYQDITRMDTDLLWKVLKCSSHEMCHLFGISHCEFFLCSMNSSNSVTQAMSQPLFLCPVCLRKLQHCCKFDIKVRYKKLLLLLQDIHSAMPSSRWENAITWLETCLEFLSNMEDLNYVS